MLLRQLRSPLLLLLAFTAVVSFFVGERTNAVIIGLILAASVGLGVGNEYRAEKAAEGLHDRIRHRAVVVRAGRPRSVDIIELAPGDIVELRAGELVPADLRLISVTALHCDESVLTGESTAAAKSTTPVTANSALAEWDSCALMGTVVSSGSGRGVVVATGAVTEFGRIAVGLGETHPDTEFQIGLRKFSMQRVYTAAVLTIGIFAVNLFLQRPLLDALLFSLAIAVGISPQLLPAVVSTSLAAGSRQLARGKESVLSRCTGVPNTVHAVLDTELAAGHRIVAVADRPAPGWNSLRPDDENALACAGSWYSSIHPRLLRAWHWPGWPNSG
ncbi:hypothetical protein [Nocardia sp. CA-135398]|uniref:P-type ATPase n=1 Tax=Nocardia sp. CA-135398 TaxID=3239977 RepID=UPI003D97E35B